MAPLPFQSTFTRLKRPDRAVADYGTALRLAPELGAAALNRGILYLQAGRYPEAEADFEYAIRHGADPALVRPNLALVRQALDHCSHPPR